MDSCGAGDEADTGHIGFFGGMGGHAMRIAVCDICVTQVPALAITAKNGRRVGEMVGASNEDENSVCAGLCRGHIQRN